MRSVALLPSIAVLVGVRLGIAYELAPPFGAACLVFVWLGACSAWWRNASRVTLAAATAGYLLAGALLGGATAREALQPSIRAALDAAYGGFSIAAVGPGGPHDPVRARLRLLEDAAVRDAVVSVRARSIAIAIDGRWQAVEGGVRVAVAGSAAREHAAQWRAGRVIEAPITFRRPTRYLNEGMADFERDLALAGVALAGSVKSALVVEVIAPGNPVQEWAADIRAHVRSSVERRIGSRDPIAAAIVTAILIGDRTALPDDVRERLQAAGTYHVIAISGGNIAILAGFTAALLFVAGARGRISALAIIGALAAYACVVTAGPSVWRATLTAVVYFAARLLDHRSAAWNTMSVSAAILIVVAPLDVRDVGFALSFGATAAILEAARRADLGGTAASWIAGSVLASTATEIVLLPIGAAAFCRATGAGLLLNLLAVPLMTATQAAGLAAVLIPGATAGPLADGAGVAAAISARALVESARLVELLPWLAMRVPPPAPALVLIYYVSLGIALWSRRMRRAAVVLLVLCGAAILAGASAAVRGGPPPGLRLTIFDVGQGDALLVETPTAALMVDSGGVGFDGSGFDIGGRVLAPALWARGIVRLDALAITHGDPDHIGGALALLRDFRPPEIWEGVPMRRHPPSQALAAAAHAAGAAVRQRLAGWQASYGGAVVRVLHPPVPDWDRPRVRNDDSLVIEVRYGNVAVLLTGDIGAEVERSLVPLLTPAAIRVLKVAHHGSRTSTSHAFVEAWRPHIALISCGRGNRFGHPAPEVLDRLEAIGARIYRTDRDGQITVNADGGLARVSTYVRDREP